MENEERFAFCAKEQLQECAELCCITADDSTGRLPVEFRGEGDEGNIMVGVCCRPADQEKEVVEPSLDNWKKPYEWEVGSDSALASAGSTR